MFHLNNKFFTILSILSVVGSNPIEINFNSVDYELAGDGNFESDIQISPQQLKEIFFPRKSGLMDEKYRWVNGIVPFNISSEFNADQKSKINQAISEIQKFTCVRFISLIPRVHADYITFRPSTKGCSSPVGRQGGQQFVNLHVNCFGGIFTIVHELLHALGFYHMHSSAERDDFVKIAVENITPGFEHNFKKHGSSVVSNFNTTFDYGSVMQYPSNAFALPNTKTIIPIKPLETGVEMGQRKKLSAGDIKRVNNMYKCIT